MVKFLLLIHQPCTCPELAPVKSIVLGTSEQWYIFSPPHLVSIHLMASTTSFVCSSVHLTLIRLLQSTVVTLKKRSQYQMVSVTCDVKQCYIDNPPNWILTSAVQVEEVHLIISTLMCEVLTLAHHHHLKYISSLTHFASSSSDKGHSEWFHVHCWAVKNFSLSL